jgi:hypothetical protein
MKRKATVWRVFRTFRTQELLVSYKNFALNCKTAIKKLTEEYDNLLVSGENRVIKRLKVKTNGGPDGIPPTFFINCCDELSYPLSLFFTYSFEHSILPDEWLQSIITPLFKKGNVSDPTNYHPISLIATMCKIMEIIIKDQLVQYLVDKGPINTYQHAFITNHLTATNLLECTNDWLVSIKSPSCTDG